MPKNQKFNKKTSEPIPNQTQWSMINESKVNDPSQQESTPGTRGKYVTIRPKLTCTDLLTFSLFIDTLQEKHIHWTLQNGECQHFKI